MVAVVAIMQPTPVLFALVATISWGLWAFFAKLAGRTLQAEVTVVVTYLIGALLGAGYIAFRPGLPSIPSSGLKFAVVSGVFFGIGGLSYYHALRGGSATVTTTVAALYFVITAILTVMILEEQLHQQQAAGIVLAVIAVILLSS